MQVSRIAAADREPPESSNRAAFWMSFVRTTKGPREVGQDPFIVGLPSRDQVGQGPAVRLLEVRTAAHGRIVDRPDPSLPRSKGFRILPAVRREDRRPFPEPSEPSSIGRPHFSPFVEMGQSRPNFGRNGKNDRIFW
jgi:hypothetical protein